VDWNVYWKNRTYRLMGNVAVSSVAGDSLAIGRLQSASARYFQRPDRGEGSNGLFTSAYDPSATSLRGFGGYLRMAKDAGTLRWETQVNVRSPGFEVNDLAFLTRSDYVWTLANLNGYWSKPTRYYRSLWVTVGGQRQFNFDGDVNDAQVHLSASSTLPNYWNAGIYMQYRPEVYDERLTRGGATVRRAAQRYMGANLSTDSRKPLVLLVDGGYGWRADGGWDASGYLELRYKPASNISVSVAPSYSRASSQAQYVGGFADPSATDFYGRRAVFAALAQRTFSLNTRLNVTFTPTLTLELFAQPFVSSGEYSGFREFVRPRTLEKREFGSDQLTVERNEAGRETGYVLDPDRDAATANFSFGNPDFNFRSLRGNAVVRWEYRPGSTLFFVWQQQRSGSEPYGDFSFDRDAGAIFRQHADNVFVVKASYYIGR